MQIHRVQNNNYNSNFGATLKISGFKEDLTAQAIKRLEEKAAPIGTMKDSIKIFLSKPLTYEKPWSGGTSYPVSCRDINATTRINDKLVHDKKPIGYYRSYKSDNVSLTLSAIESYLNRFISK